ncbi:MAG: response regulator, partial [Thermoanaerobaculia bacterium]|nr:response regulator [Thermoanaerobaculia bacterium]
RQRPAALGPIDLNRIVTDMEKLLRRVIGEDIQLITRLEPGLRSILADAGQIEQVVLNLAVNARDAMPDGGQLILETASFTMPGGLDAARPTAIAPGAYVLFSMRDTGTGIPRNVREHLFEPFFTTKESGDNTGLGLAMVYNFVERCGGVIEVESSMGSGTTFLLYLPVAEGLLRARTTSRPDRVELPRGEETVLLVEDEDAVRSLVRDILERQGYRVLSAACAEEALTVYGRCQQPPDMLLTDVVMPDRSGPALAQELAGRNPALKVLFMSGYAGGVKGFDRLPRAESCFLQKPFSPESLALKVRQVLDAR